MYIGAETRTQLQNDEEGQVDDHGPFSSISIRHDTEDDGTNRAKHQCDRQALASRQLTDQS